MDTPSGGANLVEVELADAGKLIESQVNQNDYTREVDRLSQLAPAALKAELVKFDSDIPLLAKEGKTDKIGLSFKLLKHFNFEPNVKIYLHYFSLAGAGVPTESKNPSLMQKIFGKLAGAFRAVDPVNNDKTN